MKGKNDVEKKKGAAGDKAAATTGKCLRARDDDNTDRKKGATWQNKRKRKRMKPTVARREDLRSESAQFPPVKEKNLDFFYQRPTFLPDPLSAM